MVPFSDAIRDKTRPVHMLMGALRYKTRPAPHGGTREPVQNSPNTRPGMPKPVQNSPCTHTGMPEAVQNSPCTHGGMREAVENSPCTAKNADFGPFSVCGAKIVTLQPETTEARRLVLHRQRHVPLTELVLLMATICSDRGKLTLALTRRSFPPCHVTIGILRKKYRPCSGLRRAT